MKNLTFIAAAFALSIAPAMAQEAPQISKRAAIYSADGTKIGRVEKITQGADGKPESVRIIYRGKFLTIPAASLSAEDRKSAVQGKGVTVRVDPGGRRSIK